MTPRPVSDLIAALGLFGEVVADLAGRDFDVVTLRQYQSGPEDTAQD